MTNWIELENKFINWFYPIYFAIQSNLSSPLQFNLCINPWLYQLTNVGITSRILVHPTVQEERCTQKGVLTAHTGKKKIQ